MGHHYGYFPRKREKGLSRCWGSHQQSTVIRYNFLNLISPRKKYKIAKSLLSSWFFFGSPMISMRDRTILISENIIGKFVDVFIHLGPKTFEKRTWLDIFLWCLHEIKPTFCRLESQPRAPLGPWLIYQPATSLCQACRLPQLAVGEDNGQGKGNIHEATMLLYYLLASCSSLCSSWLLSSIPGLSRPITVPLCVPLVGSYWFSHRYYHYNSHFRPLSVLCSSLPRWLCWVSFLP